VGAEGGWDGRTEGRKYIVCIVMFYVVASYDTGGVTKVSEGPADSIFGVEDLKRGTRPI